MSTISQGRVGGMSTGKVALGIVLLSESVFFGTLLAAYAAMRGESASFPAPDVTRLAVAAGNTLVLLLSALCVRAASAPDTRTASRLPWLAATLALGAVFVVGQIYDFGHLGMRVDDAAFGGVFFALMGFHALHILAGMTLLGINLVRLKLGDFKAGNNEAIEVGALFWYYVTAVWIV
ncbi:MAG TPA: cytochrome c oxidase subunit 3, partial [Anaerolineales bacterium]|nr:cytochrome c oxidase subunit 3 [Anaerolineales bacterium]